MKKNLTEKMESAISVGEVELQLVNIQYGGKNPELWVPF